MNALRELWLDGEKIPDDRIREIFRPPPLVPATFYRSSLIIGYKGAGKTTIFRYQKAVHDGLALHVSLPTEFASLTKQTARGPLTIEYPTDLELFLIGKATSLLAISIAERFAKKGLSPPLDLLRECIPSQVFPGGSSVDIEWYVTAKREVARGSLELFGPLGETRSLPSFVNALGELCRRERGPLLLMLDRADMVPTPTMIPVIELLDQSSGYIALVAARPGHGGSMIMRLAGQAVPGDHYAVVHLGILPRSRDWVEFVRSAVVAQLGEKAVSCLTEEMQSGVIAISRDSLRVALELFARVAEGSHAGSEERLIAAIEDLRENHLVAVQRTLQAYHRNFRELVNGIREQVISEKKMINGPVILSTKRRVPESLFETVSRLGPFIEAALRSGALCMPEGERWVPGLLPTELEVPPLLLWRKGDVLWSCDKASPHKITRRESDVLRVRRGRSKAPTVFVAYRMKFEKSKKFRKKIEDAMRRYPNLSVCEVSDGHVPDGEKWADVIRGRIKRAKVIVGDVTGMRPDVLFELGFAFGLSKVVIPVVSDPGEREGIPYWFGARQIGHYNDEVGLMGILSSIEAHLCDPEFVKKPKKLYAVPSLAVWMRVLNWSRTASEQFATAAKQEGLKVEILDDETPDEQWIRRAGSAALLVVCLDGTERDSLAHFICGVVVSRPQVGYATKQLARRILVLEPPTVKQRRFTAGSLSRCEEIVLVTGMDKVADETARFGRRYKEWLCTSSRHGSK